MASLRSLCSSVTALAALVPTTLAHADEATRPLGMRDLAPRSSIGVRADHGTTSADGTVFGGMPVGQVLLDGELAIGQHLKIFAALPFGYARLPEDYADRNTGGLGNPTLGVLVRGGGAPWSFGIGGLVAGGGDYRSRPAASLHNDIVSYHDDSTVLHGFGSLRRAWPEAFAQVELGYLQYGEGRSTSSWTYDGFEIQAGGGVELNPSLWLVAELGAMQELHFGGETTEPETDLYARAGMRGRVGSSPMSWGASVSAAIAEDVTTLGIGVELRADWPGTGR